MGSVLWRSSSSTFPLREGLPRTGWSWPCCIFLTHTHQMFIHIDKIPPSLLNSRLNRHSSLSLSLYDKCSNSLIIPMVLHWTCYSISTCHFYWGVQTWTSHSSCWLLSDSSLGEGYVCMCVHERLTDSNWRQNMGWKAVSMVPITGASVGVQVRMWLSAKIKLEQPVIRWIGLGAGWNEWEHWRIGCPDSGSPSQLHLCDNLYQQLEWGCHLRGLYVQVPASGETGIQGSATVQTEHLSPVAGGINIVHVYH